MIKTILKKLKYIILINKMSTEKKLKLNDVKIGTHDGTFHCDEVFACYMLKQLPAYKEAQIIRTREADVLNSCDIVVDVGGIFDPYCRKFDHHQKAFNHSMYSLSNGKYNWTTRLSSAGLIYFHFGNDVIKNVLSSHSECDESDNILVSTIYELMYQNFVESIDAIDNGVNICEGTPRYKISTDISSRIGHLNLPWNHPENKNGAAIYGQFEKAMMLIGSEFNDRVLYYATVWWPVRSLVLNSIIMRTEIDESNEIILLEKGGIPWKEHLFQLESEMNILPTIKYVIYEDQNSSWRIQCVPKKVSAKTFENRLSLPPEWRGLRDEQLSEVIGLDGCIFIHATGFIGGHKLKEGALQMARMALKQ